MSVFELCIYIFTLFALSLILIRGIKAISISMKSDEDLVKCVIKKLDIKSVKRITKDNEFYYIYSAEDDIKKIKKILGKYDRNGTIYIMPENSYEAERKEVDVTRSFI